MSSPALGCFENQGDANRFVHDLEHVGLSFGTFFAFPFPLSSALTFLLTDARGSPSLGASSATANASELQWTSKVDAFARSLNAACQTNAHPQLIQAVSTAFTARDMKSIMEGLGEEKINYWGFSCVPFLDSIPFASSGLTPSFSFYSFAPPLQLRHHSRHDLLCHVPGTRAPFACFPILSPFPTSLFSLLFLPSVLTSLFPFLTSIRFAGVILDGVSDAELYHNDLWEWGRSGMNVTHKVRLLCFFVPSILSDVLSTHRSSKVSFTPAPPLVPLVAPSPPPTRLLRSSRLSTPTFSLS
jgi:hypothetical protein